MRLQQFKFCALSFKKTNLKFKVFLPCGLQILFSSMIAHQLIQSLLCVSVFLWYARDTS